MLLGKTGERVLLLGDEAIARGLIEAGAKVVTSYPGTPASEILGSLAPIAKELGIYVEWSVNEKVAFEIAYAASLAGLRAAMACKHLGMNWLSDTLIVSAYTGVNAGLLVVVADDPAPHSSQNAEDTRYYAKLSRVPCVEPSDPSDAKELVKKAFELSERLKLPVMVRITHALAHSRGPVVLGGIPESNPLPSFEKDPSRYVMIAPNARKRKEWLKEQYAKVPLLFDELLEIPDGDGDFAVVACGVTYGYALDAAAFLGRDIPVIKLSGTVPLPSKMELLLRKYRRILVLEEGDPVVENDMRAFAQLKGIPVEIFGQQTGHLPGGEYDVDVVAEALASILGIPLEKERAPSTTPRIPALCPGCPHRASYYAIKRALREEKLDAIVVGDRGCYNQGVHPPLRAIDLCICMGASIGVASGFSKLGMGKPVIAVIGDSTFFHGGLPPLVNAACNRSPMVVVVLDNRVTAMTGRQPNPSTGINAMGETFPPVKIEDIARACGIENVEVVDPFDVEEAVSALKDALRRDGLSVIVMRHPCALLERERKAPYEVDREACVACMACINELGCPAIVLREGKPSIDPELCTGCGLCAKVCPSGAIHEARS